MTAASTEGRANQDTGETRGSRWVCPCTQNVVDVQTEGHAGLELTRVGPHRPGVDATPTRNHSRYSSPARRSNF
jgi:hypothetical protein